MLIQTGAATRTYHSCGSPCWQCCKARICAITYFEISLCISLISFQCEIRRNIKRNPCPDFIYEFKFTHHENADLNVLADEALKQIKDKKYDTELLDAGVTEIRKIGIAFRGKNAVVKHLSCEVIVQHSLYS
ncbi:MAG: PD-(D/E)XK nuclease domain-containing protein [Lachnospiraceae bacterium]|nr:PD-(D/E)XK nuclease domain-containing protein [Lachnospiraceae bacterium]